MKLKTWRSEMENKRLRVNMGKTKFMVFGSNLDVLKKSGKYPCGVCQTGVGRSAIYFGGCRKWVDKQCSGIEGSLASDLDFKFPRCLGTARPVGCKIGQESHGW